MLLAFSAVAQERTITGTVTAQDDGLPLPGVSVRVQGTQIGASTSANGSYSIKVPSGAKVLTFTFVGYSTETRAIGSANKLNVVLTPDATSLNEVVISGGGLTSRKKELGNAQTTLSNEALTMAKPTNIVAGLSGKVAGLTIQGVGSGVNPNFRIILRGSRSFTGNNQALVVLDNVIVPNSILGNLNPDDIEDINILNGSGAAALYGSQASNGAVIVTTKKGKKGSGMAIKVANTTNIEEVSFYPKLQRQFGSGADHDLQIYNQHENQQYGPRFDGIVREIGDPLPDGSIMSVPYAWTGAKNDFWDTGLTNMTDFSMTNGSENSTLWASGQFVKASGTTPGDKYNRASARVGGTRDLSEKVKVIYTAYYAQNRYDQTTETSNIYNYLLNAPGQTPVTELKDWRNNPFANPNGYFNAYYNNPYFMAENYRKTTRNDYFVGNAELQFKPLTWLDFTGRVGLSTQNQSSKQYSDVFKFSDFTKSWAGSTTYKQQDILGNNIDASFYTTTIISDFIAHAQKKVQDFKFDLTLIGQMRQDQMQDLSATVNGLVTPGIFNLANSLNTPTATSINALARNYGVSGKFDIAYRDYLFLTATGRNDWTSILAPENRSFFYPSVSLSFVPTDAFQGLKDVEAIDFIKLRGGWSKVGQVNIGNTRTFGTYSLEATFNQGAGYPYNGLGGMTISDRMVSSSLKPEITKGYEAGIEFSFLKSRISGNVNYYNQLTDNQTVPTGVSSTTGYFNYLVNTGAMSGKGVEATLALNVVRSADWNISLGANYTHDKNIVESLSADLDRLSIASYTSEVGSYAVAGQTFPVIMGRGHDRDEQGRIIVDPVTGYPSANPKVIILGGANPTDKLGVNATVKYKGFTLYGAGEYRTGGVIYNSLASTFDFSGAGINTIAYDRERFVIPNSSYLDAATGKYVANTNITVRDGGPNYWSIGGPRTSIHENYITSAAFWKLREVTLGYDVPAHFLKGSKVVKGARISVQGRNLFVWVPKTNVYTDPEYSDGDNASNGNGIGLTGLSQTPPSRFFGASLSITL